MIGIHHNIAASRYHADDFGDTPTLSSSIAKILLTDTPRHAWHAHPRLNPKFEAEADDKFNLGSVLHELFLGKGGGFEVHDFANWQTKAAKEAREASRIAGKTPILTEQYDRACQAMEAIMQRTAFFEADTVFKFETVFVWEDIGAPLCRAMVDMWDGETTVYDLKTTERGLSDVAIQRTICNLGYDLSAAFYLRGLARLRPELAGRLKFRWIFAEIEEPFEVRIIEADPMTLAFGDRKAALAIEKWRRCMESGKWPGYPARIDRFEYPGWAESQWLTREELDPDAQQMILTNRVVERPSPKLTEPI